MAARRRLNRAVAGALAIVSQPHPRDRLVGLLVWLAPLFAGAGALWLGQDASWDLRNYHFYVPFAFLQGRLGTDIAVAHVATYYNPLLHLPFYWAVTALSPRAVGFLSGAAAGLNVWLVFGIARALRPPGAAPVDAGLAAVLALLGFCGAMGLSELGTSFGDNLLSVAVLASVWVVLRFRGELASDGPAAWSVAATAGVLAGIAAGLKLPFSVFALAGCAALLVLPRAPWRRVAVAGLYGFGVLAGMAATGGFWFLAMGRRFGNPVFPYFNDLFDSPWASPGSYRHQAFLPDGLVDWLVFPFHFAFDPLQIAEVPFRDLRFPVVYVLLLLLGARATWRWVRAARDARAARRPGAVARGTADDGRVEAGVAWLGGFFALAFLAWAALFGVSRYLVPLELLAPMLAWFAACELWPAARARPWIAIVAGLALLSAGQQADWGRRAWSDRYFGVDPPTIEGAEPALVLMAGLEPSGYLVPDLPASARVLRIQGYFTGPSATQNATDLAMAAAIAAHRGPMFLLYREYEDLRALPAARHYGLRPEPGSCQRFLPEVEPDRRHAFLFCRLRPS